MLIVGSATDPHVAAVVACMRQAPVIVDAATLRDAPITLTADAVMVDGRRFDRGRGWIRRLAPEGWTESLMGSGLSAAEHSAAVSALASIARNDRVTWLTPLDVYGAAENKPLQYRRAGQAGVPVPEWIVTTDASRIPRGGHWVSKPLGRGSFIDDDGAGWVVPTTSVDVDHDRESLLRVPFLLQRRIEVATHSRVVTVGDEVFSATLPAGDLPLDWRMSTAGHEGFIDVPAPDAVHELARAAAAALDVGYSAQDWVKDEQGAWWFIDLNPAGQWLFLPSCTADPVSAAIASFLDQGRARSARP